MSTISYPPTPVNEMAAHQPPIPSTPDPGTAGAHIDIYEKMLSPFADVENARWMVSQLRQRGWPAVYASRRPMWSFATFEQARRFRADFDEILLHAAPTFVWSINVHEDDDSEPATDWIATVAIVDVDTLRPAPNSE